MYVYQSIGVVEILQPIIFGTKLLAKGIDTPQVYVNVARPCRDSTQRITKTRNL